MPNSMEIVEFLNRNRGNTLDSIAKQLEISQKQQYLNDARNYAADPSAGNLEAIGLSDPYAANTILSIRKQQIDEKARKVRSIYNTWRSVAPSRKGEFYEEMRKKFPDEMRFYPIEYNPETYREIDAMLNADNMSAMSLLGEDPRSSVGKIRSDYYSGFINEKEAQNAIDREALTDIPSPVREYKFFSKLSPEEQQKYLDIKRDNKGIIINSDGTAGVRPGYAESKQEIKTAESQGTAYGKVKGESQAQGEINLPKLEDQAAESIRLIDELIAHPGLKDIVGMKQSSGLPTIIGLKPVSGTKGADFMARFEQIQGKKFLEAYETLKGGGQITEVEGEKATQAISRLKTAQSEKEFITAAKELRDIINKGLERARQKAANGKNTDKTESKSRDLKYYQSRYGLED